MFHILSYVGILRFALSHDAFHFMQFVVAIHIFNVNYTLLQ